MVMLEEVYEDFLTLGDFPGRVYMLDLITFETPII